MFFNPRWGRRTFLRASLLTVLAVGGGQFAWGRELARELLEEGLSPGKVSLYNTHTGESLEVTYRDRTGEYDLAALEEINWLLRCHHTNEVREIDVRTIEYLSLVDQKLGGGRNFHVISGYRSPVYNERLRQQGRGVAKRSLHVEGRAIDVRVPGVKLTSLRGAALSLACGGVGYYPSSNFVHLDSGNFRTW